MDSVILFLYYNFKIPYKTDCWLFLKFLFILTSIFVPPYACIVILFLKLFLNPQEETFSMCITSVLNLYNITLQSSVTPCKKSQNVKLIYRVKKIFSHLKTI